MKKITNIKERILHYVDYKGITRENFFDGLGEITYGSFKGVSLSKDLIYSINRGVKKSFSTKNAMKASNVSGFIPVDWFIVKWKKPLFGSGFFVVILNFWVM